MMIESEKKIYVKLIIINELIYIDNNAKLCCIKTLKSAIRLVKYNEDK